GRGGGWGVRCAGNGGRRGTKPPPDGGRPRRQPHPDASGKGDHDRRSFAASAPTAADTVAASTAPVIRSRVPPASSISITPTGAGNPGVAVSSMIRTGANPGAAPGRPHSWRRHLYNWLGWSPASLASADTKAPGSNDAATSRSFSAELHRRRRSTDLITSTSLFPIVPTPRNSHVTSQTQALRKAAFTGRVRRESAAEAFALIGKTLHASM